MGAGVEGGKGEVVGAGVVGAGIAGAGVAGAGVPFGVVGAGVATVVVVVLVVVVGELVGLTPPDPWVSGEGALSDSTTGNAESAAALTPNCLMSSRRPRWLGRGT